MYIIVVFKHRENKLLKSDYVGKTEINTIFFIQNFTKDQKEIAVANCYMLSLNIFKYQIEKLRSTV
jgi:hypothetical protein